MLNGAFFTARSQSNRSLVAMEEILFRKFLLFALNYLLLLLGALALLLALFAAFAYHRCARVCCSRD